MARKSKLKSTNLPRVLSKAAVIVTLKPTVRDVQGDTIQRVIANHGFQGITEIRQGKYFEITLKEGMPENDARFLLERLGKEVLTNPVIEQHQVISE